MTTAERGSRPWSESELLTLLELLEDLKRVPKLPAVAPSMDSYLSSVSGLMSLSALLPPNRETTKPATAPLWHRLKQNPLYLRMRRNGAFKKLQKKFREIMVRRRDMEEGAHAEFEFLFWVLLSGQQYYIGRARRESQHPSQHLGDKRRKLGKSAYANDRVAARKAIAELKTLRSKGIRLDSYMDDEKLRSLLSKLDQEMSRPRKRRETAKTPATDALKLLARMLCLRFRISSPVILTLFDDWLGTDINETTIHKINSAARKELEVELARAG